MELPFLLKIGDTAYNLDLIRGFVWPAKDTPNSGKLWLIEARDGSVYQTVDDRTFFRIVDEFRTRGRLIETTPGGEI